MVVEFWRDEMTITDLGMIAIQAKEIEELKARLRDVQTRHSQLLNSSFVIYHARAWRNADDHRKAIKKKFAEAKSKVYPYDNPNWKELSKPERDIAIAAYEVVCKSDLARDYRQAASYAGAARRKLIEALDKLDGEAK